MWGATSSGLEEGGGCFCKAEPQPARRVTPRSTLHHSGGTHEELQALPGLASPPTVQGPQGWEDCPTSGMHTGLVAHAGGHGEWQGRVKWLGLAPVAC
jgi:hypothetical protein